MESDGVGVAHASPGPTFHLFLSHFLSLSLSLFLIHTTSDDETCRGGCLLGECAGGREKWSLKYGGRDEKRPGRPSEVARK